MFVENVSKIEFRNIRMHLNALQCLYVPDAERAHRTEGDDVLVDVVDGDVHDGEHVSTELANRSRPEVRVPHTDQLVEPTCGQHVRGRTVVERVASSRDVHLLYRCAVTEGRERRGMWKCRGRVKSEERKSFYLFVL